MPSREEWWWRGHPKPERRAMLDVYRALERRYGPFDIMAKEYARLTCEAWWTSRQASEIALQTGLKRKYGRGRRPTVTLLDRTRKRQALGMQQFDSMTQRLEQVAGGMRRPLRAALEGRPANGGDGKRSQRATVSAASVSAAAGE